jgi:hypothetical protein
MSKFIEFQVHTEKVNSWRFYEVVGPTDEPKIGSLYVRKGYLKELGWEPEQHLLLDLDVADAAANAEWKRTGEGTVAAED